MKALQSLIQTPGFNRKALTYTAPNVLLGGATILYHEVEVGHYRSLSPPVFRLIRLGGAGEGAGRGVVLLHRVAEAGGGGDRRGRPIWPNLMETHHSFCRDVSALL